MRIAVVSDIHGNLPALRAVVADFEHRKVDAVINLGDSLSGPLFPRETAIWLRNSNWTHLAGNHERQILEAPHTRQPDPADVYARQHLDTADLTWIATLRDTGTHERDIHFCHASPRRDTEYLLETVTEQGIRQASEAEIGERLAGRHESLILCGHTHLPRCVKLNGQLIVNPGSVGLQAFDDHRPHFHKVETRSPEARYAIVECALRDWHAELLAVPYEHELMADLAAERGFHDWAHALRTGYALPIDA